jgi:hypothetical protein
VAERPTDPASGQGFASHNGWDREYEVYDDFDLPTYVGLPSFMKLPWIPDPAELRARNVDVAIIGAPFDDAVSHRSGARFGPRAIREAQYTSGSIHSLQLGNEPFEILKVVDLYLNRSGHTALVDCVVVEDGRAQAFFVQLAQKDRQITVRLLAATDPEKTVGVKRVIALIAQQLHEATVGSRFGPTNLQDFLR